MAVLVTGGAGFVGLNLIERLLERGRETVAFDRRPPPEAAMRDFGPLAGTLHVAEGDVADGPTIKRVFADHAIDAVIHAAVITSGPERERADGGAVIRVNVLGTYEVLEAARRGGAGRVVYVSSGAVYGAAAFGPDPLDEAASVPVPDTLYGITKYAAERTALYYRGAWGIDVIAARLGGVFGRWEHASGVRDTLSVPLQLVRLAMEGTEAVLPREGVKDWVYGTDVADALITLLEREKPDHDVYHVSAGHAWSVEAWCRALKGALPAFTYRIADAGEAANVDYYAPRDRAIMSVARLADETGFRARFTPEAAAADYVDWIGRHELWRA